MEVSQALVKGGFVAGVDFQMKGIYGQDAWEEVLTWLSGQPYPTEQQCLTWWGDLQTELAAEVAFQSTKQALKEKIALAKQYAPEIATLWNVCLDVVENNTAQPTRYNNVLAAVNLMPTLLKNRLNTGTFDPASISNDTQRNGYVDHMLSASTALALLVHLG